MQWTFDMLMAINEVYVAIDDTCRINLKHSYTDVFH